MQKTLRYMTKLDRAINNEDELNALNQFYQTSDITATDLFNVLKEVNKLNHSIWITLCMVTEMSLDSTHLSGPRQRLRVVR